MKVEATSAPLRPPTPSCHTVLNVFRAVSSFLPKGQKVSWNAIILRVNTADFSPSSTGSMIIFCKIGVMIIKHVTDTYAVTDKYAVTYLQSTNHTTTHLHVCRVDHLLEMALPW